MALWIALIIVAALASSALTIPLVRRYDQWRQRVALNPPAPHPPLVLPGTFPFLAMGLVGIVVFAASVAYVSLVRPGPSEQVGAPLAQAAAASPHPMGDVASMIAGLENKLRQAPDDPDSWQMLGWSYMRTNRPADAARAYGHAVALAPHNGEYLSAQGEALVQAEGRVSPEAAGLFRRALAIDPADPRTRYFLAMLRDQDGDHTGAMADWVALIKKAPPDAPWVAQVRDHAQTRAREQGIDLAARLPAMPQATAPTAALPGPSQADIDAAGKLPDSDRQAMIHGMVDGLAAKLKTNPRDAQGWIRLMRARAVLGEKSEAEAAYRQARQVFADAPTDRAALEAAAKSLDL